MIVTCKNCGKVCKVKPSRISRLVNGELTCSRKCCAILRSEKMKGKGNHQYGLIGENNSSFKGKETISNYGYILEHCPGHPKPHDKSHKTARVKQHRLIVERNYEKFDSKFFEIISGWIVLKQNYDVHHINEIKTDNRIENLVVLTRSEHTKLHNLSQNVGVVKSDELGENPEEDNTEPSLT